MAELSVDAIDVGSIRADGLIQRRPRVRLDGFAVVADAATWRAIDAHAHSRLDVEVGGVLLGRLAHDCGQPYLWIDGHVPALAAPSGGSSVTFTADAWVAIHAAIDRDRPGAQIVGWYHTHPRFGIFLSPMDVFIQQNFFSLPQQVAIVIDPIANTSGAFLWRDGVPTLDPIRIDCPPARRRRGWIRGGTLRVRVACRECAQRLRGVASRP